MRISDWSSDVCSSDLYERFGHFAMIAVGYANHQRFADGWMVIENFLDLAREYLEPANSNHVLQPVADANVAILINQAHVSGAQTFAEENQIGRASCREGVSQYV